MKPVQLITVAPLVLAMSAFAQSVPHINAVVSAADSNGGVTLGGLATIYGTGLSDAEHFLSTSSYPAKIGPTEVLLCVPTAVRFATAGGCISLGLTYASPTQINIYLPDVLPVLPGLAPQALSFVVRNNGALDANAAAGNSAVFNLSLPQPRIFSEGFDCSTDPRYKDVNVNCGLTFVDTLPLKLQAIRGAVTDQRGAVLSSANRAHIGQYYTVWLTGLGQFKNGKPLVPLSMNFVDVPVHGYSGSTWFVASPEYVGPSSYLGLYQVNFKLPSFVAEGTGWNYATPFPCGDYNWEISVEIGQGDTFGTRWAKHHPNPGSGQSGGCGVCWELAVRMRQSRATQRINGIGDLDSDSVLDQSVRQITQRCRNADPKSRDALN